MEGADFIASSTKEEGIFTVKIEKSTLTPPRKIAGQELPGSNIAVRIECSANEGIYIHGMTLQSDVAEQTCYVGDTYGKGHVSGSDSHVYLDYQGLDIEVTLLGLNGEVLFHEIVTIEEG